MDEEKIIGMVKDGVIENTAAWNGDLGWKKAVEQDYDLADLTGTEYGRGDSYSGPFLPKEN